MRRKNDRIPVRAWFFVGTMMLAGCSGGPDPAAEAPVASATGAPMSEVAVVEPLQVAGAAEDPALDDLPEGVPVLYAASPPVEAVPEADSTPKVRSPLGEIEYVDVANGFVLVRSFGGTQASSGARLEVWSPEGDRQSNLLLGAERKGRFLVADITAGVPAVSDQVFYYADPTPAPSNDSGSSGTSKHSRKSAYGRR